MSKGSKTAFHRIFLTVGTTEFDELIKYINDHSQAFFQTLGGLGCKQYIMQIGRGVIVPENMARMGHSFGINVEIFRFKPNLSDDMYHADLVISHCGAGSIIEALSLDKVLIVVVNSTLQGNHQTELSDELSSQNYCYSTTPEHLISILEKVRICTEKDNLQLQSFPKPDHDIFPRHLDSLFS